ncbi:MAG: hypothetical protein JHD35_10735 [Sphingopyxis sp.]|nr:hypothetical protein [Sphingopyxis sp.]
MDYVHSQWQAFAAHCAANGISLQDWKETELTKALQARLSSAALAGQQPFDGDFIAEHERFELDAATFKPICVSRTDLEWLLSGFPRFTIEFKLLDGTSQLRTRYWRDGLRKFIAAIYAPQSGEAAMWAFLRRPGHTDGEKVMKLVAKRATQLSCATPSNPYIQPSSLAGGIALFDTAHNRGAGPSPLALAHVFTALP